MVAATTLWMTVTSGIPKAANGLSAPKVINVAKRSLSSLLKDPSLLEWTDSSSSAFKVYNPACPDNVLAEVPIGNATTAIQQSHQALPLWRDETTASHRASLLTAWSSLLKSNVQDLATIMTLESGKPLAESKGEVNYAASFLDYYAAEAIRPTSAGGGFIIPTPFVDAARAAPRGQIMAIQQAVGVTALITPWNFPMAMITRKAGPALAAGCTAVVKPSELTPLSAIALKHLAERAGIPSHVFQIVAASTESAPYVGAEFCTNSLVQKVSFTGSTRVGKILMEQSSSTVKRLSLELGGNAPFVVFEDADIDNAVNAAMSSKFRNAGQTCVCADRFLIHASVHDEFVSKLVQKVEATTVGDGMEEGTQMGPLISEMALKSVADKVLEAIEQDGAILQTGGPSQASSMMEKLGPQFYPLTVLTDVAPNSRIWKTETFGPVVPVRSFETEDEALQLANDSSVGLAAYFCTKDLSRAFRFAQRLECGIVGVNDGIISTCSAPFGGVKESGLGREGSAMGLAEYLETKYIFLNT